MLLKLIPFLQFEISNTGPWAICNTCEQGMQGIVNRMRRHREICRERQGSESNESPIPKKTVHYSAQASYFAACRGIRDTKIEKSRGIQDKISL